MKNLKFRAVSVDTNKMIYGYGVIHCDDLSQIIHKQGINIMQHTVVKPETLGQFTGLKDKNGVDIYKGDIVKMYDWGGGRSLIGIDTIIWYETDACWQTDNHLVEDQYDFANKARFEVIGNIYVN